MQIKVITRWTAWLIGPVVWSEAPAVVAEAAVPIDRQALVSRHNPRFSAVDPWAPLSVGNGGFCFTADVTGLQTFSAHYQKNGIPLETQARWAWHSNPNPAGYKLADAHRPFAAYGQTVDYPTNDRSPAGQWLRENPHARPLPRLALELAREGGGPLEPAELREIDLTLDLWSGEIRSRFRLEGELVAVNVACHPEWDALAISLESELVRAGRLAVRLDLPRGHDMRTKNNPPLDWSQPESHTTTVLKAAGGELRLRNERDGAAYFVRLASADGLESACLEPHSFRLGAKGRPRLEFTASFGLAEPGAGEGFAGVVRAAREHWPRFWRSGGAVDFTGSKDPRARELERRVVLSQYLAAIQFAGGFPPSESGLTHSSWYQKHHTEMIWWHAAHFALWGRDHFLEKNLRWYIDALPRAREIARGRGLKGARWPKMVGPDWRESPGGNPLIVWNQPHPIHLAELLYRSAPTAATLARYRELVLQSAECMAAMLHWEAEKQRFNLGPPLWIAQEIHDQASSMNPCYELSAWSRGLQIAQHWRERLGPPRDPEWDRRLTHLAPLPQKDGKYVALESHPDTWDNRASRHDHPSFLMAFGQLPGDGVDSAVMARTLDAVLASWDWETKIWGWDYPMVAMTAARLGEPRKAVDVLLKSDSPNNRYTASGHCPQRGDLPVYLPANGALLAAVAMMAGGWGDAPATTPAPGFPQDGTWVVRSEGLRRLP
ncbi:MAG: hypothetical protein FJ399_04455 [Verrucomicrobia bacterium]|nr:hypothetical protein [Verrucomicrobiota bacterium]